MKIVTASFVALLGATSLAMAPGLAMAQAVPANYPASYADMLGKAKTEGKVVLYSNMSANQWKPFVELAAKTYPWMTIEATDSGDEMWEKYYAESSSRAPTADLMLTTSVDRWVQFAEKGEVALYETPELSALPGWSIPIPGVYTVSTDPFIMVYNKHLIAANDAPKSRQDVLNLLKKRPDLKGKITTMDPVSNSSGLGVYWRVTQARPEEWALLEGMGSAIRPERSAGTVREKLVSGEYSIALLTSGGGIPQFERPEIKAIVTWLYPSDGVPLSMRNIAITKAAPHPNAARVFLDLLLSREGSIAMGKGGQTPYRSDIKAADVPYDTYTTLKDKLGEQNLILIRPDAGFAKEREPFLARWKKALAN